jgi:hypothetical protein
MAIYSLRVSCFSRSRGQSATAAAAYRAGERIRDDRTGELHDYSRKRGVVHRELVLPEDAPGWARERERLWNAAEAAETRKNSTVAREFMLALPAELNERDRARLAVDYARSIAERHRCAVDVSLHRPGRGGDTRNHHAHLLCTTRRLNREGFKEKTRELDDAKSGEVVYWRERWADLTNERLRERGSESRIDHRTLEAQGIDRAPTLHKGPMLTAIERRGIRSRVVERLERERAEDVQARLARAAELGRLERESRDVERSILVLSTDIAAARRERDGPTRSAAEKQRSAPAPVKDREKKIELDRWRDEVRRAREEAKQSRAKDPPARERGEDKDRNGPDRER